ncbi:hypothetical protein ACQH7H_24880 [Escherichia coli]|uniref:hypothetical protein n=1 Tax=Escherichia coli TaxID=562 RepID=UPI003CF3643A
MVELIGLFIAIIIAVGYIALKALFSIAFSWALVTVFGWVANLVGVDIYSVYDKGIVVIGVAVLLLIFSMINKK